MVVPTAAALFRLKQQRSRRTTLQLPGFACQVGLVGVAGVRGEPCQVLTGLVERPRQRDEPLKPKDTVQHLRPEPDRSVEAPPQLSFGDIERRGERIDVLRVPR